MRRRNDRLLKGPLAIGLFVLALAIQNFIVQRHVHGAASGGGTASTSASAMTDGESPSQPPRGEHDACPFCQVLHGGSAITPLLPALAPLPARETVALHAWDAYRPLPRFLSRHPPRAPPARPSLS